jgi:undecaprenyl-diphosphatase
VVALATFVVVSLAALLIGTESADRVIRSYVLTAASPGVVAFMRIVNVAGDWRFLLPATLLLLAVFDRARRTWWVWIALMIAAPLAEGALKIAIGRARPDEKSLGYPSGHATAAAAYFGAVLYLSTPLRPTTRTVVRVVAVLMIVLVGVARVMLRAHWPSDVLGGCALGLTLASAAAVWASSSSAAPARARRGS